MPLGNGLPSSVRTRAPFVIIGLGSDVEAANVSFWGPQTTHRKQSLSKATTPSCTTSASIPVVSAALTEGCSNRASKFCRRVHNAVEGSVDVCRCGFQANKWDVTAMDTDAPPADVMSTSR